MGSAENAHSPAGIAETVDVKRLREEWTLYIHSKEFEELTDRVFLKSCKLKDGLPGHDDDELDQGELQYAMDEMYETLNHKANGKLPRSKDSALKLLRRFDQDKNGRLDHQEFRRFAMVYFNRLEWPLWKAAAKGMAIGLGVFFAWKWGIKPAIGKSVGIALPKVVKMLQKTVSAKLSRQVEDIILRFSDGNPLSLSGDEAKAMAQKERAERWRQRRGLIKGLVVSSAVGSSATVAGLL